MKVLEQQKPSKAEVAEYLLLRSQAYKVLHLLFVSNEMMFPPKDGGSI